MRALSGLLPKPKRVRLLQGETELTSGVAIALTRYPTEEELVVAKWLEGELKQRFGIRTRRVHGELEMSDGRFIRLELLGRPGALKPQGFLPPFGEWYAIRSDRRGILLTGGAPEGLRNAGQTLLQLCRNDATARVS
ncbi:MAG TPA: glycoside hydrolase family 20 zincin-like fold domain-containing protein, partial [Polyangiaceae bacterium]